MFYFLTQGVFTVKFALSESIKMHVPVLYTFLVMWYMFHNKKVKISRKHIFFFLIYRVYLDFTTFPTTVLFFLFFIPHPDPPSHLPLHPIPLGLPSAPGPSTCLMHPTWAGDLRKHIFLKKF